METLEEKKKRSERSRETRKRYREQNRDIINKRNRDWRSRNKSRLKELREVNENMKALIEKNAPNCMSKITRLELIEWAVEFVNRVESRKGMVSFEELFGELLDISFYIPTRESEECQDVNEQLMVIWNDVKHFANAFKKELVEPDLDRLYELRRNRLCKFCEIGSIVNTHNTCSRCRGIMVYINRLG